MKAGHKKYILDHFQRESPEIMARRLNIGERAVRRFLEKTEKRKTNVPGTELVLRPLGIWRGFLVLAVLALAGLAAYANSFSNTFVWDDKVLIEDNKHIESFSYLDDIFREDLYHAGEETGYYRPMQTLCYMLEYHLWGRNPLGYHVVSFVLHVANAFLVFLLSRIVLKNVLQACLTALLFIVHPAFVPVVSYVSGRADLLGFLFAMITVNLGIGYSLDRKGRGKLWIAAGSYILAVLSKSYYATAPLFTLLHALAFGGRVRLERPLKVYLLTSFAVALFYGILRSTFLKFGQDMGEIAELSLWTRLHLLPYLLSNYVFVLALPVRLGLEKQLVYSSFSEPRFLVSYLTIIIVAFMIWRFRKKEERELFFFTAWFLIALFPVSNVLLPLKHIFADHWTYLASVGFWAFFTTALARGMKFLSGAWTRPAALCAVVLVPVAVYAATTVKENLYWKNEETLYARLMEKKPSSRTLFNLGRIREERGELDEALRWYDEAVKLKKSAFYHWTRGHLHRKRKDHEQALEDFREAVRLNPGFTRYRNDLGVLYAAMGRRAEAEEEWRRALELNPEDELARKNLGFVEK